MAAWLTAIATLSLIALAVENRPLLRSILGRSPTAITYPYEPTSQVDATQQLQQEIAFYQTRIQQRPNDGLDRTALAQTYLKMARATGQTAWFLLAEKTAQESLKKLPFENSVAVLVLAQVAEAKHDFSRSIQLAKQVLTEKPESDQALALLVTGYLAQGKVSEAEAIAQPLSQMTPTLGTHLLGALTYAAQGKDSLAIAQFEQALAREEPGETGSSARLRTLFGRFYAERGDLQQAQRLYREALRMVPQYPLAMVQLAEAEAQLGRYRRAHQLYSQVFTAGELATVVDHTALAGLAELAQLQGDRPKAKALWDEAEKRLRAHPDLEGFGHRRELAQILLARGDRADLPEALDLMRREAQVRRDAQTLDTLAWALLETAIHSGTIDSGVTDSGVADSGVTDSQVTGTQNLQAAAAIAQEALQQNPNNAQLLYR
ncbi:MAG: tetratricopeptide repeat protein, partial [Synechococcales cyanobacterium CRU_2_2]|nr:tetratricopeptide repeat protein [Synechococcales cyanobacterium CRU_2_2]